jgi:hypothetical protein
MPVPFGTVLASSSPVTGGTFTVLFLPTRNGAVWDITGLTPTATFIRPDGTSFSVTPSVIAAPAPYNSATDPNNPTGFAYITVAAYTTLAGSTATAPITGNITAASNASPIVVTSVAHGRLTNQVVTITGVLGNTAANGTWVITKIDADHFSLNNSVGNGVWTSGGAWTFLGDLSSPGPWTASCVVVGGGTVAPFGQVGFPVKPQ